MAEKPNFTHDFNGAKDLLGNRDSRWLENHTYLERINSTSIGVRLWNTRVVVYNQDETTMLSTGSWYTVTTKDRIHRYAPYGKITSDSNGWWYNFQGHEYVFQSGMVLSPDGTPNTRRRDLMVLGQISGREILTEDDAAGYITGLELKQVKALMRRKHVNKEFILGHCQKEFVPAFLDKAEFSRAIAKRLSE